VIWLQASISFLIWLAYGLFLRRRSEGLRVQLSHMSRQKRVLLGSVGIIGSALVLLAGLYGLASLGGIQHDSMTLWAWPAATLLGVFFVHMQVLGAAAMITLVQEEVTRGASPASVKREESASLTSDPPQ
jgi:hypothetical protein